MDREEMLVLLAECVACHAPPGQEQEIDALLLREFQATGLDVWQDAATNIYAHLPGVGPKVMVCAHKDEIAMVVTHIEDDGRLRVENCGGSWPWKYGEGPVDVLADDGSVVRGILSIGSVHTNSGPVHELKSTRALTWDLVSIFTGLSTGELAAHGIHVGARAVVARARKHVQRLGDYIASFALDDRMGLVAMIAALRELAAADNHSPNLFFVATHGEEIGMLGAVRAAQLLEPEVCVALDTSPVVAGMPLAVDERPVIWYRERVYNDKAECDRVLQLANELGFGAQPAVYAGAASDAGRIKEEGLAGRTVCFGFARDNSHGFEIAHVDSLANVTRLLTTYLSQIE